MADYPTNIRRSVGLQVDNDLQALVRIYPFGLAGLIRWETFNAAALHHERPEGTSMQVDFPSTGKLPLIGVNVLAYPPRGLQLARTSSAFSNPSAMDVRYSIHHEYAHLVENQITCFGHRGPLYRRYR